MQNQGSEQETGADDEAEGSITLERVELPDHASAYYSPVPPPATTQHQTIETEAVRIEPQVDADFADTQRIQTHDLPSIDRNAPTLMLREVAPPARPPGGRAAFLVGATAIALGALLWSVTSSDDEALTPAPVEVIRGASGRDLVHEDLG
jgi:hypothetical protein